MATETENKYAVVEKTCAFGMGMSGFLPMTRLIIALLVSVNGGLMDRKHEKEAREAHKRLRGALNVKGEAANG